MKQKYNIIYADPPWSYSDKCHSGKRGAEYKYSCMSIDDIKALPIQSISADNCVLFLWVTFPMLREGLDVITAWGFCYKTVGFVWVKRNKKSGSWFWGMGNWTRCLASDTKITLLDVEADIFFEENLGNLEKYDFNKIKIWSPTGWKKIKGFIKNVATPVNKIETNIGTVLCSNNHKWVYKKPIKRRIGTKQENVRKMEHVLVEGTFEQLYKDFNSVYVRRNKHSVNLLFSEKSIEVINPIENIFGFDLTVELGWILGLFCAEGSYSGQTKKQTRFSLHSKEVDKYERIKKYIESLGITGDRYFNSKIQVHRFVKENKMEVYYSSKKLKTLFELFIVGEGAHHKRLNLDLLMKTTSEFRLSFLQGMFDGDGHLNEGKYQRLYLCNKELIEDFQKLCLSVGKFASFHEPKPQMKNATVCHHYGLQIYNQNRHHNFKLRGEPVRAVRIDSITRGVGNIDTCDIEVEDGLFVANNLITHNSNAEICLIGIKGKPQRVSKSVHSVIDTPIEIHSKKPDVVRDRIIELCGDLPRLEMFSRVKTEGWSSWGNEIESDIDLRDCNE